MQYKKERIMDKIIDDIANFINSKDQQVIIGISGHGASGKTTFANKLIHYLGDKALNFMNTDPYIIGSDLRKYTVLNYEYNHEEHHYKMTACHPTAHHLSALERDIHMIRKGLDFYTIGTHFKESTFISSAKKVTIIEGMSMAFLSQQLFDLTVYLYTDGETEFKRREIRDISERGTDIQYLRDSHQERRIQYELFMHPYHQHFDVVIKNNNQGFIVEKYELIY